MGAKVPFLFSVVSLVCLRIAAKLSMVDVAYDPSTIVLKPGLDFPVSVWFFTTDPSPLEVKLILDGADDVCLSVNANDNTSSCEVDEVAGCSTTCTFQVDGLSREFNMTYKADKNSLVIPSDKSLTMKVESNPPVQVSESEEYHFTARDGRKVVVGFADSLHRLVAEDPLKLPIVRYGNKSLSIDKDLTIAVTLWQSDDGENWKKSKSLPNINEKLTNSSSWTVIVDDLNKDLFYKVDLTTSLSDVVKLQPSVVKIYPTLPKLQCGELADNVRDLVRNHLVNETVVDNMLDQMCRLVKESNSSQIDTTSPLTDTPIQETIATSESPAEPIEVSTSTSESPAEPTEVSTSTSESPEESTTTADSDENGKGSQDEESSSDNTTVEDSGSSMLWFAFLGLVAVMLAVGVSGYLLFNHHAKVKVYLFQLVGKSGSSSSPSTGRRGKPGAAKYTPLPTNVRETMLHQD